MSASGTFRPFGQSDRLDAFGLRADYQAPRKDMATGPFDAINTLAERPRLDGERPRRPRLLGQPKGAFGNIFRLDEKVITFIVHHLASVREVDHAIQNYDGHVNAGGPERACHGFRKDTLRGLGKAAVLGIPRRDAVAPTKMMLPVPALFMAGITC